MTACPRPLELLLRQLGASDASAVAELDAHVRECARCREALDVLKARLALSARAASSRDEHLDEISMAELLDVASVEAVTDADLAHLAECEACRDALTELSSLTRDPAIRAELDRPEWRSRAASMPLMRPATRRFARVTVGAAAAAALLFFGVRAALVTPQRDVAGDSARYRHATIASAAAPRLVSPAGAVASVDTLRWTSVPKADRYRVTVFDANGGVAWEAEGADTSVAVPSEIARKWRGEMRWRVKARTSFDRWVDSEFGAFVVGAGS
ncbi:MAG TPA: hypothetical protein VGO46_10055 [Gemmatimonadaceae bacterium]|nr:hypothetical protein [Gemmatimonadaceae bacterium]